MDVFLGHAARVYYVRSDASPWLSLLSMLSNHQPLGYLNPSCLRPQLLSARFMQLAFPKQARM